MRRRNGKNHGFTLIELSIVLVIIGLIVGGVLVGQDLIRAAATRAQISQIERYNTAVNTFRLKYGYLPGDIPDPYASQFGLQARGTTRGQGDGNGLIEGTSGYGGTYDYGVYEGAGETVEFWVDLSTTNMMDGNFTTASTTTVPASNVPLSAASLYFPTAKIGNGNYVYVFSDTGINYFGISALIQSGCCGTISTGSSIYSQPGLTVSQAYSIDKKIDDGFPQSGAVTANYVDDLFFPWWANGSGALVETQATMVPYTTATPSASNTCYDNGNIAGAKQQYSMSQNGGNGINCALSFKMQGAAR